MSPSEATNQATRAEWRDLGFYYERGEEPPCWQFVGSRSGLHGLVRCLGEYIRDPRNEAISEHEHYGPYMYFKITTWDEAEIGDDGVRGTLGDLARLRELIEERLRAAVPGQSFTIGPEYAASVSYPLRFDVQQDGFDLAAADRNLPRFEP